MKMNKVALSIFAVGFSISGAVLASSDGYHSYESTMGDKGMNKYKDKDHYNKYHDHKYHHKYKLKDAGRLALNVVGRGEMYPMDVPDIDGDEQPDPAYCFDVELKNIADGEVIGTATDCLSNITPAESGTGVKLVGTTYFNLPGGQIVTRGLTTVQPVLEETVTPDGVKITHITGASSDKNSIIKATGDYKWHLGKVRLSGMVNLEEFTEAEGDPIYFDCFFTIDLKKIKFKHRYWYKWYDKHHYQDYYDSHYGYDMDKVDESEESYKPYEEEVDESEESYKPYEEEVDESEESYDPYEEKEEVDESEESYDPYEEKEEVDESEETYDPYEEKDESEESYEATDPSDESYEKTDDTTDSSGYY